MDLSFMQERLEIRSYICNGKIDDAIEKVEEIEPEVCF